MNITALFEEEQQNRGEMLSPEATQSTPTIIDTMVDDNVISCNQAHRRTAGAAALSLAHTCAHTHTHTHRGCSIIPVKCEKGGKGGGEQVINH